ncbi:MAG: radical SAM protein [Planctomycetota bacterium]
MRVALLYPPDFVRPTMIFGALPLFSACLKEAGHDTVIHDVNAESFTHGTRPETLRRYLAIFDQLVAELRDRTDRSPEEDARLDSLLRLGVYSREVMLETESAMAGLKDPEQFYDPARYRYMDRVIKTTHRFLNALTPRFDPRHQTYNEDLYRYLASDAVDPLHEYVVEELVPRLREAGVELVAMSCPFSLQVATGLFLAKILRRHLPGLRFVMGGTGVSDSAEIILGDARFFDYVDYAIVGDGEEALVDIVAAVEGRESFDAVAGLWRREGDETLRPVSFKNVDLDRNPTPDYRDVDFSHYMLPEKAGIYTTSRGCYYGKCTFCPESFRIGFRKRSPQRVYEDVKTLVEEQGVKYLHFFDPLTPPVTLEYVSKQVARDGLDFNWYAEVKFEKIYTNKVYVKKLAEGGCKQLQFGFESGVQRVLDRMKKGNDLAKIEIILRHLREHGITMCGTWFIGFPTETEDDARTTWRFWREHPETMHLSLYTGTFGLAPDVPVFHTAEDYDVEIVVGEDGFHHARPRDGVDWDKENLHTAFHVRSDIELTITGASLLYGANAPEKLYALRAVAQLGPTSFDAPALEERVARFGRGNTVHVFESADGSTVRLGYVADSQRDFPLDEIDVEILRRIGTEGRRLGELFGEPDAPADLRARLATMIDRGLIESEDPLSVAARISDDPAALAG